MRTLRKNKQRMYYALQKPEKVPIYELDADGNIVYIEIDGVQVPVETGEKKTAWDVPVQFFGNIAMSSSGEAEAQEFGLSLSEYSAVLITERGSLPITETSLIWFETAPEMNADGTANNFTADYRIVAVKPSLSFTKYLLQKVVK